MRVEVGELILASPEFERRERDERIEVLDELYDALRREQRFERGLEVVRLRNDAGWRGTPDGRCDEAEMLLRTGRRSDALALWEDCWEAGNDPWWVGNNACLAMADAGEHQLAVEWAGRGMLAAIAAGDPVRLMAQLCDLRRTSLEELGRPGDELQRDGEAFVARVRRAALAQKDREQLIIEALPVLRRSSVSIAVGWFPRQEYERAQEVWPDALERFAGVEHGGYSREVEADLRALAAAGVRVSRIVPVTVDGLIAHAADTDSDPAGEFARAGLAAELAGRGGGTPWPPGRNDPCWCGRPAKYKRCCATVEVARDELDAAAALVRRLSRAIATARELGAVESGPTEAAPALMAELDRFPADPAAAGAADPELEQDFRELISDVAYPWMLELVKRSPGASIDQLLEQVMDLLDHPSVRAAARRQAVVRLALAEALSMSGRPADAHELAEGELGALAAAGERPDTVSRAYATSYLIDLGRVEEAERRWRQQLAERPDDAGIICEIAGDTLSHGDHALEAIPWLAATLERAIEARPFRKDDVRGALARLRAACAAAGVDPDRGLARRAADLLGV